MSRSLVFLILIGLWSMPVQGKDISPQADAPAQDAGKVVLNEDFSKGLENWHVEKWEEEAVKAVAEKGKLRVTTTSKLHGTMIWCKKALPKNFQFDFDFTPVSKSGFFLIFFCAKGIDGKDVLEDPHVKDRSAPTLFKKYTKGKINCYHISYRRGEAANCNLRKNSGQKLLKQQKLDTVLPAGKTVHVKLVKKDGALTLTVDDKVFMEYTDDGKANGPILEGGRIALRQVYVSESTYSNIKIMDLD